MRSQIQGSITLRPARASARTALERSTRIFLLACLPAACLGYSNAVLFPLWSAMVSADALFCFFAGATQIYSSWGRIAAELRLPVEILSSTLAIGALSGMAALLVMVAVSGRIRPLVTIGCCLLLGLLHWAGSGQHLRSGVLAHRPRQRLDLDPVAAAVHPAHAIQ